MNFPASKLRAAVLFACTNDVRYYINGVYIDSRMGDAITVAATNGHVLFATQDKLGETLPEKLRGEFILDIFDVRRALLHRRGGQISLLEAGREQVRLQWFPDADTRGERSLGEVLVRVIDGKFPDWRPLVAKAVAAEAAPSLVDPKYLALCQKADKLLSPSSRSGVARVTYKGDQAAVVTFSDPSSIALVMPMRDVANDFVPHWCRKLIEVVAPAGETQIQAGEAVTP